MQATEIRTIGHQVKQPLTALSLMIGALNRRLPDDQECTEILSRMRDCARQLHRMLLSLLDFLQAEHRIDTIERRSFPVMRLIEKLVLDIEGLIPADRPEPRVVETQAIVWSDPLVVEIILRNLLLNALLFAAGGKVLVGCRRAGDHVRILVCDTGIGIPESKIDYIFQPLAKVRAAGGDIVEGLGLGLPAAERLAHRLGHPLTVRSVPGKGTSFCLTLPIAPLETPDANSDGANAAA